MSQGYRPKGDAIFDFVEDLVNKDNFYLIAGLSCAFGAFLELLNLQIINGPVGYGRAAQGGQKQRC